MINVLYAFDTNPTTQSLITIDYEQIPDSFFQQIKKELGIEAVDPVMAAENEFKLLELLQQEGAFATDFSGY